MTTHSDALDTLIAAIGLDATVRAIELLGGTRWHVAKSWPDGHPLVQALGREIADKLAAECAGETGLRIPRDKRVLDGLIARDAETLSQNELAIRYRLDVRSIQNALARHRRRAAEGSQGDLWAGVA